MNMSSKATSSDLVASSRPANSYEEEESLWTSNDKDEEDEEDDNESHAMASKKFFTSNGNGRCIIAISIMLFFEILLIYHLLIYP